MVNTCPEISYLNELPAPLAKSIKLKLVIDVTRGGEHIFCPVLVAVENTGHIIPA